MNKKVVSTILSATALVGVANAGTTVAAPEEVQAPSASSFCDSFASFGKLYSDKSNPYIQEFKIFGRAQYQWGYTDGSVDGDDFSAQGDELRRLRFGSQIQFLNKFKLKGQVDLNDGSGFRSVDFGYKQFDELHLSYEIGDVAGVEGLALTYGRQKFLFSPEVHTSSNDIKTVERSSIANYFYDSARPTGLTVKGATGGVNFGLSVYSGDEDEAIGNWDDGNIFLLNLGFAAPGGNVLVDFAYDNSDATGINLPYEWGTSVAYLTKAGNWDLMLNGIFGSTDDGDSLYGFVAMPSTFIIADKLEFVGRYQYFGSAEQDVKINSRNVRNAASFDGESVASGDSNHSLYAGLNYYFCGNNSKIMTGLEYEILDGDNANADVDATTLWVGYRMFF